ncbi:helix-turn-helix domain-containing protein (plasmid) [Aneurinibacillus thermoaerophilus]|nr:helix-turn-helix domain-containing protein [Aneurinibacillus thermoaerophilus]
MARKDTAPGAAYMTKESRSIYTACEDYDFCWDRKEVIRFREMWEAGADLMDIAKELGRHVNEVAILVIDQAEKKKIGMHASKRILGQAV